MDYSLDEVCQRFTVSKETVGFFIEEGMIIPVKSRKTYRFTVDDCDRIRLILNLQHEMGVNTEGVAVALHLLDKFTALHLRMQTILYYLDQRNLIDDELRSCLK